MARIVRGGATARGEVRPLPRQQPGRRTIVLAVKQAAAADTSIMMSQAAFRLSETHWMGRTIKYAGLHGIDVDVVAAHLVAEGDQPSTSPPPILSKT